MPKKNDVNTIGEALQALAPRYEVDHTGVFREVARVGTENGIEPRDFVSG